MSVSTVITEGFGSFGNTSFVVTEGFGPYAVTPDEERSGAGNLNWLGRKKKKSTVIRYADFDSQEAYAAALAAASVPVSRITEQGEVIGDDPTEEDDMILLAIVKILH